MTSNEIIALADANLMPTYARFPVAFIRGEGARLFDAEDREYLDFSSGIGVNSIGYADEKWIAAVASQAGRLAHISNLFYTEPCTLLAARLNSLSGMSGAFFGNSGAEANEGMIKLARKYSFDKYGGGRSTIVTLENSFHGRTVATLEATGQERFHNFFMPFTGGFKYAEAGNIEDMEAKLGPDVCAVMIELIQGEGGVMPLEHDYVGKLTALCRERDILLLVDEVQTGVGRTGTFFAFQQYDILPDAVSFAKGIAGGLPLGGLLVNEKCAAVLGPGTHASTFGGNPICCSAALAVLDILDGDALLKVREKGAKLRAMIEEISSPIIAGVRGLGLMLGIQVRGIAHSELVKKLLDAGLVCLTAGSDVFRLMPPLTITDREIERGVIILADVLEELK